MEKMPSDFLQPLTGHRRFFGFEIGFGTDVIVSVSVRVALEQSAVVDRILADLESALFKVIIGGDGQRCAAPCSLQKVFWHLLHESGRKSIALQIAQCSPIIKRLSSLSTRLGLIPPGGDATGLKSELLFQAPDSNCE